MTGLKFDKVIAAWREDLPDELVFSVEAEKLIEGAPSGAFFEWLQHHGVRFLATDMRAMIGRERKRMRHRAGNERFQESIDNGHIFDIYYCVGDDQHRRFGDMVREDLISSALIDEDHSRASGFEAAFKRAVAKQLKPGQTVQEKYSPEQLHNMRLQTTDVSVVRAAA